jgi:cell division GTPase FtsZ
LEALMLSTHAERNDNVDVRPDQVNVIGFGVSGCAVLDRLLAMTLISTDSPRVVPIAACGDAQALANSLAPIRINLHGIPLGDGVNRPARSIFEHGRPGLHAERAGFYGLRSLALNADVNLIAITSECDEGSVLALADLFRLTGDSAKRLSVSTFALHQVNGSEGTERPDPANLIRFLMRNFDAVIVVHVDWVYKLVGRDALEEAISARIIAALALAMRGLLEAMVYGDRRDLGPLKMGVRDVLRSGGAAVMGIGSAYGVNGSEVAAQRALVSPLLGGSIAAAKRVLFTISTTLDARSAIEAAYFVIADSLPSDATVRGAAVPRHGATDETIVMLFAMGDLDQLDWLAMDDRRS